MLEIGTTIVHPSHGKGVLKEVQKMLILGTPSWYYIFDFKVNELDRVMIPVEKLRESGIRLPVNEETINETLDYLKSGDTLRPDPKSNFHRVHKEYSERIARGDILEVAKVYKALYQKSDSRELGLKDKLLFEKTEQLLVGEIEASCHLSTEDSIKKLQACMCIQ